MNRHRAARRVRGIQSRRVEPTRASSCARAHGISRVPSAIALLLAWLEGLFVRTARS